MTILQSKSSQQGDADDPPPKKKLKKSKGVTRSQAPSHTAPHPAAPSAPGPSHRRTEQRPDCYSFLPSSSSTYFPSPERDPLPTFYGPSDQEIVRLELGKFDVGLAPTPATYHSDFDGAAGPSQVVKTQIYNPECLEYYIYGPGSRSPNSKSSRPAPKRSQPDVDVNAIEVISSEDIVDPPAPVPDNSHNNNILFPPGSLLDDINNFDFDDKFGELEKFQQDAIWEDSKLHHENKSVDEAPLMNGYDRMGPPEGGVSFRSGAQRTSPAASLSNLGNTCFLNSVLYTLRFAPDFLHNLHHLVTDMNVHATKDVSAKQTSSLGRNMSLLQYKRNDKDVYSEAGDLSCTAKTKKQIVTEKLHGVYEAMRAAEAKEHSQPFHPEIFLTALREVNPIFEGNQQQDAHELLVCLLDIFRETCQASARQAAFHAMSASSQLIEDGTKNFSILSKAIRSVKKVAKKTTTEFWKNKKNAVLNSGDLPTSNLQDDVDDSSLTPSCTPVENFVAQDFEGVMVLRTTCLQCENMTEKKEPFADICVPIKTDYSDDDEDRADHSSISPSELYQRAVVTDEFLRDKNKYYCEECMRYNEAKRSVRYQTLPRLLTLQLKRFSSTYGAMSKVTNYMPTPMTLDCFCEECGSHKEKQGPARHAYELYGVIMHLGPNMAGGHYIAYVRMDSRSCAPDSSCHRCRLHIPSNRVSDCCAVKVVDSEVNGKYDVESPWVACDDDIVKVLSSGEVESLLSESKSSSNQTPYLLFYARRTE